MEKKQDFEILLYKTRGKSEKLPFGCISRAIKSHPSFSNNGKKKWPRKSLFK